MQSQFLVLYALAICLGMAQALSCSHQWQCEAVSEEYSFVSCSEGTCKCRTDLGFVGAASESDKCRCQDGNVFWGAQSPYCKPCSIEDIIYDDGHPYCVDPAFCEAEAADQVRSEAQKQVIRNLYNGLIYPTPLPIIQNMDVEGVFAPDVHGRVTPVGDFDDFEGSIEYFYGLAASPSIRILEIVFIELESRGNKVNSRVDLLFNFTTGRGLRNITQSGYFTFTEDGELLIQSYDLNILRLGEAIDSPPVANGLIIQQICQSIQTFCPAGGPYEEYADHAACVNFMSGITFGTWSIASSNTVVCRQLHNILIPYRPDIHCPHVGPTGGGKCEDKHYDEWYSKYF